jgi:hypothetical protein
MELIQSYLEKVRGIKRVGGIYVLKIKYTEEDTLLDKIKKQWDLCNIDEQWGNWIKEGIIDAPLMMISDFAELDYEEVFTFERAIQLLREKERVRRQAWKAHTHLFVDQNGVIMKYVNHDCVIPFQVKAEDMEVVDWELYRSEW